MPRKTDDAKVTERLKQRQRDDRERRSAAAKKGAQTRRRRAAEAAAGERSASTAESATQRQESPGKGKRGGGRPPKDPNAVTIAFKGEIASTLRALAKSGDMSLAQVVQEAVLVLEAQIGTGYELGTALRERRAAANPQQ